MASEKSPGKTGATTDMLKNLPEDAKHLLVKLIQQYSDEQNCDFDIWHVNILYLIYKGKATPTTAKIVSAIVKKCLLKHINTIGTANQLGHIGYQEALRTIHNILITC